MLIREFRCKKSFSDLRLGKVKQAWLILPLFFLLSIVTAINAQQTVRYEEYLSLIGRTRGEAVTAVNQRTPNCTTRLRTLSNQLNSITQISMPNGSTVAVDHAQAGLPTRFPACDATDFVRFLNGICPPAVCLTTGEIVAPPDPLPPNESSDVQFSNLADFSLAELTSETPIPVPQEIIPQPDPLAGEGTQQATDQPATGETAVSPNNPSPPNETSGDSLAETAAENGTAEGDTTADSTAEADAAEANEGGAEAENGETAVSPTATAETAIPPIEPESISAESTPNRRLLWAVLGGTAVLLIGGVGLFIYLNRNQKERPLRPETERKVQEDVQEGRQHLTKGEYREAIGKLFNATLRILEDRGMLRFEQTRTNYELLNAVSTFPRLVPHLAPIVDAYDRVWYGYEPLETDEFETLSAQIEALKLVQRV